MMILPLLLSISAGVSVILGGLGDVLYYGVGLFVLIAGVFAARTVARAMALVSCIISDRPYLPARMPWFIAFWALAMDLLQLIAGLAGSIFVAAIARSLIGI